MQIRNIGISILAVGMLILMIFAEINFYRARKISKSIDVGLVLELNLEMHREYQKKFQQLQNLTGLSRRLGRSYVFLLGVLLVGGYLLVTYHDPVVVIDGSLLLVIMTIILFRLSLRSDSLRNYLLTKTAYDPENNRAPLTAKIDSLHELSLTGRKEFYIGSLLGEMALLWLCF